MPNQRNLESLEPVFIGRVAVGLVGTVGLAVWAFAMILGLMDTQNATLLVIGLVLCSANFLIGCFGLRAVEAKRLEDFDDSDG